MISTRGNDIYREGRKIGWFSNNRIYDQTGKSLGYFTSDTVYDVNGRRLAHIEDDKVYSGSKQMRLEDVLSGIAAVGLSDAACVAITTLL